MPGFDHSARMPTGAAKRPNVRPCGWVQRRSGSTFTALDCAEDYGQNKPREVDRVPSPQRMLLMTISLALTPELERRLKQAAEQQGLPADALAVRLLEQHLPPAERREELVALLQSWIDGDDVAEQQETGEYLVRVLDEDRLSDRKLFPPEMKGVTW